MEYIKFQSINKKFGENHVLKDINLDIEKGKLVTLLGPSGCGKSTLLRCLSGLEQVSDGKIYLDGQDITEKSPREREIGMVFQQYSLFPNMTVAQNIGFGLKMRKVEKSIIQKKVDQMLEVVDMGSKRGQYPAQLSGGQQQRVALARALVTEPKVLLLDEPLSAIDALLRRSLQTEIRRIQKEMEITAIFVTHDQDEAMVMSDVIHLFHDGRVEQSGSPVEIYTRPNSSFSASFIGHYNILEKTAFTKLFKTEADCKKVAIRPEIIRIGQGKSGEDEYCQKVKIINLLSHGNIIRYTVTAEGMEQITLDIDVMAVDSNLYQIGEQVDIYINKKECIFL